MQQEQQENDMKKQVDFTLLPDDLYDEVVQKEVAAARLKIRPSRIQEVRVRRRSIDARRAPVRFQISAEAYLDETPPE